MLIFRVGNTLMGFLSDLLVFCERKSDVFVKKRGSLPSLFCHERPNQIAHGRFKKKSKWAKSDGRDSLLGIKRWKTVKNIQKYEFFSASLVFGSNSLESQANHSHSSFLKSAESDLLTLLFCKERCEWIAHGHSFVKSDMSESLTVAL